MRSRADQIWQQFSQGLLANPVNRPLRIAVLAAHPDDEAIGASSVLGRHPEGAVVFLTDGAPRNTRLWPSDFCGSREDYAAKRRAEADRALAVAGLGPKDVFSLGAVDQEAIFSARELARSLAEILAKLKVEVLVTHSYEGGHPDHDAAAFIAALAVAKFEVHSTLLIEMTSYHARDGKCVSGEFLPSAARHGVDVGEELSIDLCPRERERKQRMFTAYASQSLVLRAFSTDRERFRRAPSYNFSCSPHPGTLWYESMGWMSGEQWRALATQHAPEMREHACR